MILKNDMPIAKREDEYALSANPKTNFHDLIKITLKFY
jgi:hypothetical protein